VKRYGLSALEKIKSKKDFEKIFTGGEITFSSGNIIRAHYLLNRNPTTPGSKFAVAVGKKLGSSVWRNRVRRLIRTAYRGNKLGLIEQCKSKNALLEIIFSPQELNQIKNRIIKLKEIESSVVEIIYKIKDRI
jgi:ribonuclease P protein component